MANNFLDKQPLLKMIFVDSDESVKNTVLLTILASLSSIILIFIINNAAENASDTNTSTSIRNIAMFVIAFGVYFISKRISFVKSMKIVENIVKNLRIRISDKVRYANLESIESIGLAQIQTRLSTDTLTVSNASYILISAVQGFMMFIFGMIYILYLSRTAFVLTFIGLIMGIFVYRYYNAIVVKQIDKSIQHDEMFFSSLLNIIDGFNELKINTSKSDDVIFHHSNIVRKNEKVRNDTNEVFANSSILIQFFAYLLLGSIVFIVPQFSDAHSEVVTKVVAVLIFMMSPIDMITGAVPTYSRANRSAFFLNQLENEIDALADYSKYDKKYDFNEIKNIKIKNLFYKYKDKENKNTFSVGPIDLNIEAGKILFIKGGNGSGKSTIVKLLISLYKADKGSIYIDDKIIKNENIQNYRSLFALILSDFHLFDRLYGIDDIDVQRVDYLLNKMELSSKISFVDGRFDNLHLSTGQKKRLALVMALMEDKKIYILDEWAADQDPDFREYFYHTILPELKSEGKTVIAVTHDEKYFDVADRIIKIEEGKIVEDENLKPLNN